MAWRKALLAAAVAVAGFAPGAEAAQAGRRSARMDACAGPGLLAESAPGRIVFDDGAQSVSLTPVCPGSLAERVEAGQGRRFILLVDDIRAARPTGAVFSLHLDEPGAADAGEDGVLGSLSFFAARPPQASGAVRRVSYDVTRTVRALARAGRLDHGLVVRLRPTQAATPGAQASVARLQLVEH